MMDKTLDLILEPVLIPSGVTLGAKEHSALIIVDSMDLPALIGKI